MKIKILFFSLLAILASATITEAASGSAVSNYVDAAALVNKALKSVPRNFPATENQINAFYKERVIRNNDCVSVNEAILNINKSSYSVSKKDQVAIKDVRGNYDEEKVKSMKVKLQGGPVTSMDLDVAKNPFLGSPLYELEKNYIFEYLPSVKIHGKDFYVVKFEPKNGADHIMYKGKIYIEKSSYAIGKVEFSLCNNNLSSSHDLFLKSKPSDTDFKMIQANYVVNYREYGNKWYLDYTTSDVSFYLKRANETPEYYSVNSQLAVTSLIAEEFKLDKKELLKSTDILSDMVQDIKMASDWDIYNLIMLLAINY